MMLILQFAFIGLLAGSAIAQSNAGLPSCAANGCVTSDYGGCEALDIECICTQGDWIAGLACCVSTACDAAGQEGMLDEHCTFAASYVVVVAAANHTYHRSNH